MACIRTEMVPDNNGCVVSLSIKYFPPVRIILHVLNLLSYYSINRSTWYIGPLSAGEDCLLFIITLSLSCNSIIYSRTPAIGQSHTVLLIDVYCLLCCLVTLSSRTLATGEITSATYRKELYNFSSTRSKMTCSPTTSFSQVNHAHYKDKTRLEAGHSSWRSFGEKYVGLCYLVEFTDSFITLNEFLGDLFYQWIQYIETWHW